MDAFLAKGFADVKSGDCPGCGHGKAKQNIEYGGGHDDHPSKEDSLSLPPALHPNSKCDGDEKYLEDNQGRSVVIELGLGESCPCVLDCHYWY